MKLEFSTFSTIGAFEEGENGWKVGYLAVVEGIQNMLSRFSSVALLVCFVWRGAKNDETLL